MDVKEYIYCPCCNDIVGNQPVFQNLKCPVINNVVYDSVNEAHDCLTGKITLIQCSKCGFIFNMDYDKNKIIYDSSYDNARNYSNVYQNYLDHIVNIFSQYISEKSTVLEVGCGNGDFITRLSDNTGCNAFGYDKSYEGNPIYKKKVFFHKSDYYPECVEKTFSTLILRHVLEHIPEPYDFIRFFIGKSLTKNAIIIIEVPNFKWIRERGTFYDITYEHCNYFSHHSLSVLANRAGFYIESILDVFDGQYLLLLGRYTGSQIDVEGNITAIEDLTSIFKAVKSKILKSINLAENVAVWGASGKGVVFLSMLSDELLQKIKYVIDINPSKQGKYLPVSAKKVDPPEVLTQVKENLVIIVMNRNYIKEIRNILEKMGVKASLINAY